MRASISNVHCVHLYIYRRDARRTHSLQLRVCHQPCDGAFFRFRPPASSSADRRLPTPMQSPLRGPHCTSHGNAPRSIFSRLQISSKSMIAGSSLRRAPASVNSRLPRLECEFARSIPASVSSQSALKMKSRGCIIGSMLARMSSRDASTKCCGSSCCTSSRACLSSVIASTRMGRDSLRPPPAPVPFLIASATRRALQMSMRSSPC